MKQALGMCGRVLSYYLVLIILCFTVTATVSGDNLTWLVWIINLLVLGGFGVMMYADGGYRGERAATLAATMERQAGEGRAMDPENAKMTFKKSIALKAYLLALAPLVLIASANLIAEPYYPPVIVDESAMQIISVNQDEDGNLVDDQGNVVATRDEEGNLVDTEGRPLTDQTEENNQSGAEALSEVNWFSVVARMTFIPLYFLYALFSQNPHGLNLIFLLFCFVVPVAEIVGYLSGPRLRKKKLSDIEKGKKRKMRNLKVNKKKKMSEPAQPKPEV